VLAAAIAAAALLAGHSAHGTPIQAVRTGPADAPVKVLAVGDIHGNEQAGRAVIRRLRASTPPAGVQVWTVASANPDGEARGTRHNARGVDLNRNFPFRWRATGRAWDTYFPGRAAASEPETRAMQRLIRRLHPAVTVWFHQHLALVNDVPGADHAVIRAYGRRVGLPVRRLPYYRGTATSWQNHALPDTTAFVVELPAGPLSAAAVRRHARAVLKTVQPPAAAARAAAPKPRIVWSPIPFGARRKKEMAAYSRRHYGDRTALLTDVRTIVEHITAGSTYQSAYNTFANDVPDGELGELPATCAHFVIDRDGTIHQLVRLRYRCRHTVGLNDRSIGIEHVGLSDGQVMGNAAQRRSSLRLTRWLQARYDVPTRYVIGHAESLSSPFHHERVARLRTQTHGDMVASTMRRYRRLLG
jgi:N-acetylmuramoyl-L-alanine amidase